MERWIWPGMYGSGWRTSMTLITMIFRPRRIRRGYHPGKSVYCAAARGASIRIAPALPIAAGAIQIIRGTTTDFVAPAIRPHRGGTYPKGARLNVVLLSGF
jgi:hypothetical protein